MSTPSELHRGFESVFSDASLTRGYFLRLSPHAVKAICQEATCSGIRGLNDTLMTPMGNIVLANIVNYTLVENVFFSLSLSDLYLDVLIG